MRSLAGESQPQRTTAQIWGRNGGLFGVVFVSYAAGAVLAWESFGSAFGPAFFFPPAGVTVAAMALCGRAKWPAIGSAAFLAELAVDVAVGNPVAVAAGFAAANVLEPVIGASLVLAWCQGSPDLRRRRDFWAFVIGACLSGPAVGGLVGGIFSAYQFSTAALPQILRWWSGDALGVLVVAAPILLWPQESSVLRQRRGETAIVLATAAAGTFTVFRWGLPPATLVLPVLAWAAVRLSMLGAALAGAVVAFLANVMVTRGFAAANTMGLNPAAELALTQGLVAILVVTCLLIAQEAGARARAVRGQQQERSERLRLESLSGLAQRLSAALTPQDVGRVLADELIGETGCQGLNLGVKTADSRSLEWMVMAGHEPAVVEHFGIGVALGESLVATDAMRTGQPVIVGTAEEYTRRYPDQRHWRELSATQSIAGWPLVAGSRPIGVLLLTWKEPQPFDAAQQAYFSAAATMTSQALRRALIYAEEHARTVVLHSAAHPVASADAAGLDYRAFYQPSDLADGLGGDWYVVMPLPGRRTLLAIGDVIGHGLMAVEDMTQLRAAARAYAHQGLTPARLMAALNSFAGELLSGEFATAVVTIYDLQSQSLSYSAAGHPPALLRRADNGDVTRLSDAQGTVLGPVPDAAYSEGVVRVCPGDVLMMFTDGVVERTGENIDAGIARAERVLAEWQPGESLSCTVLLERLSPPPRTDDVCLLIARFGDEGP